MPGTSTPEFRMLVVAKAPVVGEVKTRLGVRVGMELAAQIAAASLIDTLRYCARAVGVQNCHLAITGDLDDAVHGERVAEQLDGWQVHQQVGADFAQRLAHAHRSVGAGTPTVQIGMDTPQLTPEDLRRIARPLARCDAVVAPAIDGGWWALGLRNQDDAQALQTVEMSTPRTGIATVNALRERDLQVAHGHRHRDLDEYADAVAIAAAAPHTEFALSWRSLLRHPA